MKYNSRNQSKNTTRQNSFLFIDAFDDIMQSLQNSFNNYHSENKGQLANQIQNADQQNSNVLANQEQFIKQEQQQFKSVSDLFKQPGQPEGNDQMLMKLLNQIQPVPEHEFPNFSSNIQSNIPSPRRAAVLERQNFTDLIAKPHDTEQPLRREKTQQKGEMWTDEEHNLFLQAISKYGRKKQTQISQYVRSKDVKQVISHSQKFFKKLQKVMDQAPNQLTAHEFQTALKSIQTALNVQTDPQELKDHEKSQVVTFIARLYNIKQVCPMDEIMLETAVYTLKSQPDLQQLVLQYK